VRFAVRMPILSLTPLYSTVSVQPRQSDSGARGSYLITQVIWRVRARARATRASFALETLARYGGQDGAARLEKDLALARRSLGEGGRERVRKSEGRSPPVRLVKLVHFNGLFLHFVAEGTMKALDLREVPVEGRDRVGHLEQARRPSVASPLVVG
jgi:hypothetical protein